jgi:hypothetical protein
VGWLATGSAGVDLEWRKRKRNEDPLCMITREPRMRCKSMEIRNHVCFLWSPDSMVILDIYTTAGIISQSIYS